MREEDDSTSNLRAIPAGFCSSVFFVLARRFLKDRAAPSIPPRQLGKTRAHIQAAHVCSRPSHGPGFVKAISCEWHWPGGVFLSCVGASTASQSASRALWAGGVGRNEPATSHGLVFRQQFRRVASTQYGLFCRQDYHFGPATKRIIGQTGVPDGVLRSLRVYKGVRDCLQYLLAPMKIFQIFQGSTNPVVEQIEVERSSSRLFFLQGFRRAEPVGTGLGHALALFVGDGWWHPGDNVNTTFGKHSARMCGQALSTYSIPFSGAKKKKTPGK